VPKAGRNEPCPCGSGKKYKKCHGAGDDDPRPVTRSSMTAEQIRATPFDRLGFIDPEVLADGALTSLVRRYLDARIWPRAEALLEVLVRRSTIEPERATDYRCALIATAVGCRRYEVAHRQVVKLDRPPRDELDPLAVASLAVRARSADAGERLLAAADSAVRGGVGRARVLAHLLLDTAPAIGILIARGALEDGGDDSDERLLDVIEEARARLGLPHGDPAANVHAAFRARDEATQARGEADGLRTALRDESRRARDLELRVRELESQVAAQRARIEASDARPAEPVDVRELRAKIEVLQATLRERNEERVALRRQLEDAGADRDVTSASRPSAEPPDVDGEPEDGPPIEGITRRVVAPTWTRKGRDALIAVPAHVARDALRTVADLAAADTAAWSAVKRPKAIGEPLLMARIGIHYRLLFRVDDGNLEVVDLVSRSNLDVTLKRLREA
jgi:hypothetical protein